MVKDATIPFDPPLDCKISEVEGEWALIIAHGKRSKIDSGFLPLLSKKLEEKGISSILFNFPFRQEGKNRADNLQDLDQVYQAVWEFAKNNLKDKRLVLAGHGIGAEVAIRSSGLIMTDDGSVPLVVSLSYPLYPPNRPEMVDAGSLGAVMGDVLFIQPEKSNTGTFDRLKNSLQMMVPHAAVQKISNADHEFNVDNKSQSKVAYWVANDIERFLKNLY